MKTFHVPGSRSKKWKCPLASVMFSKPTGSSAPLRYTVTRIPGMGKRVPRSSNTPVKFSTGGGLGASTGAAVGAAAGGGAGGLGGTNLNL